MSLFGTIQQSSGALQAAQVGLQVIGNNVANANTEGYIRQRLELTPAGAFREGNLLKGQGVRPTGITQVIDKALHERMIAAGTDVAGAEALSQAYSQLEEIANELDNNGLNQQLSLFNNALHELSTQPGDPSMREFVVLQGDALANKLQATRQRALDRQIAWSSELSDIGTQINRLVERIASLNVEIATVEGGGLIGSDATGLRDQRYQDLEELASFVDINIQEQFTGTVNVFVGGDYLVSNGIYREVDAVYDPKTGGQQVRIVESDAPLQASGGRLGAAIQAREGVFGDFINQIDKMASSLIRAVNEVHSQGQGRKGFLELTGSVVSETGVPLDEAGYPSPPHNGTFDISLVDADGELLASHRIKVKILGAVGDSTVNSIVADLNAIDGLNASVSNDGRITIESDTPTSRFVFGEDTSGFLVAAGINSFFVGQNAGDIQVNDRLIADSDYLAVSRGGIGADTDVLTDLLDLVDRPLDELGGRSVRGIYEQTIVGVGQKISLQNSATEGLRNFYGTLQSQHLAITGVNIDEESIKMIAFQRAFQASSRVIATANEMLEILLAL